MPRVDVNNTTEPDREIIYPRNEVVHVHKTSDSTSEAGINFIVVLIVLVAFVALLALIFYGLPNWFGTSTVNVNIRAQ
jgi:hypothetical protein